MATAGFIAGICEAAVTYPFEVVKTQLQANPSSKAVASIRRIRQTHGAAGFFHGLPQQLLQTSVKTSLRFGIYARLKPLVRQSDLLAGLGAGALEALLWIAPTERLKVLRITQPSRHTSLLASVKHLVQQEGPASLWRGGAATVARNSMTVGLRFSLFETAMSRLSPAQKRRWYTAGAVGFAVGFVSTILNNPVDVLKTRMNSTGALSGGNNLAMMREILASNQMFQGLGPRILKISIGQAVIFGTVSGLTGKV
jgi:hypothetical protein